MFDFQRFLRLAAVHWAESGRSYLWFLGIGIGVHFCVWLLLTQAGSEAQRYDRNMQLPVYVAGYVLSSALFAARHFSGLGRRESALTFLMRPASSFEKFLLALLVVAVAYPLAYTLAFQVCNLLGAELGRLARDALVLADDKQNKYLNGMDYSPFFPFAGKQAPWMEFNLFLCGAALQGLIVTGGLWFRRMAWLKTLVALFLLVVVVLPLLAMLSHGNVSALFWDVDVGEARPLRLTWLLTLWLGVPALFWASAYFFLRERELT